MLRNYDADWIHITHTSSPQGLVVHLALFFRFQRSKWLPGGHLLNIEHTLLSPFYKNCYTYQFLDMVYHSDRKSSCAPDHFFLDLKIQHGCLVAILKMFVIANAHKLWCRLDSYFTHEFPTRSSCAPSHFLADLNIQIGCQAAILKIMNASCYHHCMKTDVHISFFTLYMTLSEGLVVRLTTVFLF